MDITIEIFLCYAHEDIQHLNKLKAHLKLLQRQGRIDIFDDSFIIPGLEWESEIEDHLDTAQIVLLLVSSDFMNSDRCHKETTRALERHESGEARVIPLILRQVYWQDAPFGKLQALPTQGKPIVSWPSEDDAFYDVEKGIRKVIEQLAPLLYQKHIDRDQADKALNKISENGPFGYIACPECNGYHLAREPFTDFSQGKIAHRIHCKECGWVGKMISTQRKA